MHGYIRRITIDLMCAIECDKRCYKQMKTPSFAPWWGGDSLHNVLWMNVYTYLQKTLYVCSTGQNTTPGNLAYPYLNKTQIPCYWIPKMVEKPVICERTLRNLWVVGCCAEHVIICDGKFRHVLLFQIMLTLLTARKSSLLPRTCWRFYETCARWQ